MNIFNKLTNSLMDGSDKNNFFGVFFANKMTLRCFSKNIIFSRVQNINVPRFYYDIISFEEIWSFLLKIGL